jgi:predicted RND superfamily exporter protein
MDDRRRARDELVASSSERARRAARPGRFIRLLEKLAWLEVRRPGAFLWLGLVASLVALFSCTRLTLRTRFEDLLPERSPSVIELGRLMRETAGGGQIFVLLEGAPRATLRHGADALAAALRSSALPALSTPALDLERLLEGARAPSSLAALARSFPEGYYENGSDPGNVVVVKTSVAGGDLAQARSLLARVEQRAAEILSLPEHAGVRARFAGDLVTSLAEYGAAETDLLDVGALGLCLVLGVVLLYFMRLRVLLLMAVAIAAGLSWTFGCTALLLGHLNLASGSLISLVTGSSINHGIIFMARYFEERRAGLDPERAVVVAHAATGPATLTAALAGAAAYGCLAVGDFPLLDHFALVGALGMFLCWLSTLLLLGPALLCLERRWPLAGGAERGQRLRLPFQFWRRPGAGSGGDFRLRYEQPFAFLVSRFARPIALVGGALAVVGLIASAHYARAWPTEYDMRRLQNDLGDSSELYATSKRCADILGAAIESSMVVLAERPDQVPALKHTLEAKRDASPSDEKPFEAVHTLFDFVPDDQPRKLSILSSIRSTLLHLKAHASDQQWRRIESLLPPADLVPFDAADLPIEIAAPFSDRNGLRGRIALIEPAAGHSDSDLRYLIRWANAFRETQLPNGEVVRGSGRAVVFADMLQAVQTATPRTLSLSLVMTTLVVAVLFRGVRGTFLVFATLFTGIVWLGLMMSATGVRLNFMNFIALPVTFGIAVDYPVNFLTRLRGDPRRDVLGALRGTGGAIILCSLTTLLGYTALLASVNQAIRSLGLLCVLGELACVTAATLLLPAVLVWHQRTRSVRENRPDPVPSSG